ncbi:MAG: extracellular solute-binding protein [Oscillospiraceae bacterium]|nr:extracellular solute-binding protein [Oscillospiraceae bacterium]
MKKWIALFLCAVLLLGLAACGETTDAPVNTDTPASAPEITGTEEGWDGSLPLVQPGEDNKLTIGITTSANVTDYKDNAYTKWLEEQTGVDLEFVQFSGTAKDAGTQVSLMIAAGEELPDILWSFAGVGKTQGEEYGVDGYFLDLKPYFDEGWNHYQKESLNTLFGDEANAVYHKLMDRGIEPVSGGLYDYPSMEEVPLDSPKYHTWINQQWLDTLGLEAPKTIDELHDVLVAFRDQDPNGNGKKDEIPMIGVADGGSYDIISYLINAFIFYNYSYHYNVTDGKLWAPYDTDEYRQALITINQFVSEGLISPLTWTQTNAEMKSLINGLDGTYVCGVTAGHADLAFEFGNDSMFRYVPLHPLADETGRGGYCPLSDFPLRYTTRITCDCENPDLAFKFLDFTMSQESYMRQRWGEYGVDWEWSDGSKPGNLGGTADFKLLNPTQFSSQNAGSWHAVYTVASEKYYEYEVDFSDLTDWDTNRALKLLQNYQNALDAGQPDEMFTVVAYTADEYERRTDVASDLQEYIKTSRTQFCNGILDPTDDATWNEYLDNLKAMHFYDDWIEPAQTAYDRLQEMSNS